MISFNKVFGDFITEILREKENYQSIPCPVLKYEPDSDVVPMMESNEESNIEEEIENHFVIEAEEPSYQQFTDSETKSQVLSEFRMNIAQIGIDANSASVSMEKSSIKRISDPDQEFNQPNKNERNSCSSIGAREGSFICEICQKIVNHSMHLIFHRKRHLNQYPIHCRICLQFFSSDEAKIAHESQCNERRFDCYACGMILSSLASLKYHFQIHSGVGSFQCENSPKRFKRSNESR